MKLIECNRFQYSVRYSKPNQNKRTEWSRVPFSRESISLHSPPTFEAKLSSRLYGYTWVFDSSPISLHSPPTFEAKLSSRLYGYTWVFDSSREATFTSFSPCFRGKIRSIIVQFH